MLKKLTRINLLESYRKDCSALLWMCLCDKTTAELRLVRAQVLPPIFGPADSLHSTRAFRAGFTECC